MLLATGYYMEQRKLYLLSRGKICKPKKTGGLGLHELTARSSLNGKADGSLVLNTESLCCAVVSPKHRFHDAWKEYKHCKRRLAICRGSMIIQEVFLSTISNVQDIDIF